jgi:hypothetical protein|eukprot:COSAG01_NODE_4153_length_5292_cov_11.627768_2_plen_66_part_00
MGAPPGLCRCPDCVAARTPLQALFSALPSGAAVIEAPVTRAEWKGNAAHPYHLRVIIMIMIRTLD